MSVLGSSLAIINDQLANVNYSESLCVCSSIATLQDILSKSDEEIDVMNKEVKPRKTKIIASVEVKHSVIWKCQHSVFYGSIKSGIMGLKLE